MFLKSIVLYLKLATCLLLSRPFGNIIHDVAQKYGKIEACHSSGVNGLNRNFQAVLIKGPLKIKIIVH